MAESYHPDIVLSDVMMSGTSGIALLKSLQAEDSSRPVILTSGCSTAVQAIKGLDLLTKPLDYSRLKSTVEATQTDLKSLKKSRLSSQLARNGCKRQLRHENPEAVIPSVTAVDS